MNDVKSPPANSNFIKSMIRIANPDWTPEQVEAEAQKKLREITQQDSDDNCEFCSS